MRARVLLTTSLPQTYSLLLSLAAYLFLVYLILEWVSLTSDSMSKSTLELLSVGAVII